MSYQKKKLNLVLDDKKDNINLISIEKSPNRNNKINYDLENKNFSNKNNYPKKEKDFSNDLLNTKNDDEMNLSNINIEKTQKFINNADILFTEEEEKEDEFNNNDINNNKINNRNINTNNLPSKDISRESISIDESKRIELANNLFENSLSCSIRSNDSNDVSLSLVSDKRREVAEQLFQSVSDIDSKKRSLNETFKSNKSSRTNMSHVINNLSGSNLGLNINAIANKYSILDKVICEKEIEASILNPQQNNNINNSINNSKNLDEQNEDEISFRNNMINRGTNNDFKKSNDLNNINSPIKNINNRKDNNLIPSFKKNDLMSISKENNNDNKLVDIESKNNISKYDKENNENNNSHSEISFTNIVEDITIKKNKNESSKNIIDENNKKEKEKEKKEFPIKKSLIEIIKNKRNNKKEEKKIGMIEKEDSEGEASNDILNNKIRNSNDNNESSILNYQKASFIISIDDDNNSINKRKVLKIPKKNQLIKSQEKDSVNNKEEKETNDKLISKNKLITEKNETVPGEGRNSLLSENDQNKFIKIIKKKKEQIENDDEDVLNQSKKDSLKNIFKTKNKNQIKIDKEEQKLIYFNNSNSNNEKRFKNFLQENNYFYNEEIYDKKENGNQIKEIKENSYFERNIIKQETIYDFMKKKQMETSFYFDIMKKTYEENKSNFNLLFQFISNKDKDKLFKFYKTIHNYNISNYHISPYINDISEFCKTFNLDNIKNIDFIRYSIDENEGETFYRCFMFNLFEKYIINQDKDNLFILILDIFKLYDLSPSIYSFNKNNNTNTALIFFSIISDYIQLNSWDKAYDIFVSLFSQIDQILITYIKYNIFLFLSKIYSKYEKQNISDIKYLNQYKKILIKYNEPSRIIFQLIPYIFGININLIYYENKRENDLLSKKELFALPKNLNISQEEICIIYYNNCYHIGYQKNDFNLNDKILTALKDNINKISLIHYIKKDKIYCDICDKDDAQSIEIINDSSKKICQECLNLEIDDYLLKRISFINEDNKSNYINYSFYLRPIELILKEPISIKNNIENNSIIIKNSDYYQLFHKTFSQRISELFKENLNIKNIQIKLDSKNSIKEKDKDKDKENDDDNNGNCIMCQKSSDILSSECGCKFCEDCLYDLLLNITNNQIILNGYEKMKLYESDGNKCPTCEKKINIQHLIILLEECGRDFEVEYNEAKIRMKNYVKTLCFICLKKFENEKSLEVSHNSKRDLFHLNVMINKHCIKDSKKNKKINDYTEKENEIDYCDSTHIICLNCYKKNKGAKIKEIENKQYKVFICNICGIRHYISAKDWDKWNKNEVCCKCNIF